MPGSRSSWFDFEAAGVLVRVSRWDLRNIFDLPTVQGAIATVAMAV